MWYWLHNENETANKLEFTAKKARKIHAVIILAGYLNMLKDIKIFAKNCFLLGSARLLENGYIGILKEVKDIQLIDREDSLRRSE